MSTAEPSTLLVKMWLSAAEYERRQDLDENGRAVMLNYTHDGGQAFDEDDLPDALQDAARAAGDPTAPIFPEHLPTALKLRLMAIAAYGWIPPSAHRHSRWKDMEDAKNFLKLAYSPSNQTPPGDNPDREAQAL